MSVRFFGNCHGNVCLAGSPILFVAEYDKAPQDCLARIWYNETFFAVRTGYGKDYDTFTRTFLPGQALTHVRLEHGSALKSNLASIALEIVEAFPPQPKKRRAVRH